MKLVIGLIISVILCTDSLAQRLHPIVFVTQTPITQDFTTIASVLGNHRGSYQSAPRGGDLYILYPDGTLKNITKAAGFGDDAAQGANSIAVRDPAISWDGTKVLFSMVIGNPTKQYEVGPDYYFQMYEVTGLGKDDTPVVTKVLQQPATYNNVNAIYGTNGRIIFASDKPRNGERHLYPQLDEYEEAPTVSGLWSLDPTTGDVFMLDHAPSGDFSPTIDSYGRVLFTRWDHLQRDQQADADSKTPTYGTFDYSDESANAQKLDERIEIFPEPRGSRKDLLQGTNLLGHNFNHFFPWQIREDGTKLETLNHIGRHELHAYFERSFNDDTKLIDFNSSLPRTNQNYIQNLLQIKEDPNNKGLYYGIDAYEFFTHASGQIVTLMGAPHLDPDSMIVNYLTHRSTSGFNDDNQPADPNHSGHYRDPLPLSDGSLMAVHTSETRIERNEGTRELPQPRYHFRLKTITKQGDVWAALASLTSGIKKNISYWDPDVKVTYNGELWELQPVELKARTMPVTITDAKLAPQEQAVFDEENVSVTTFTDDLKSRGIALVVSRNVTYRDPTDKQQPYQLRIEGTTTESPNITGGKIYDVSQMQFLQADQLRGKNGIANPAPGRRVLARIMHDTAVKNPIVSGIAQGAVKLASDGSMAAFVPARRAMTWHMLDNGWKSMVKERYWLTMQPGEIRTCVSCHGTNEQAIAPKAPMPENKPEALRDLLRFWKASHQTSASTQRAEETSLSVMPTVIVSLSSIRFSLAQAGQVRFVIYNTLGNEVSRIEGKRYEQGDHTTVWRNPILPTGMYYIEMITTAIRKRVKIMIE